MNLTLSLGNSFLYERITLIFSIINRNNFKMYGTKIVGIVNFFTIAEFM
jgi:hypothetical protein